EGDLAELQLLGRELEHGVGEFAVDRALGEAADQVADVVGLHGLVPRLDATGTVGRGRLRKSRVARSSIAFVQELLQRRSNPGLRRSRIPFAAEAAPTVERDGTHPAGAGGCRRASSGCPGG